MEKNVGGFDRTARLVVGPLLIIAALAIYAGFLAVGTGTLAVWLPIVALVLGAVLTVTGYTRMCPIWRALGINTYNSRGRDESRSAGGRAH